LCYFSYLAIVSQDAKDTREQFPGESESPCPWDANLEVMSLGQIVTVLDLGGPARLSSTEAPFSVVPPRCGPCLHLTANTCWHFIAGTLGLRHCGCE
jgi:hypothetical protein